MGRAFKEKGKTALEKVKEELEDEIGFYQFQQYEFDRQWKKLHTYAKEQGIQIIGDIPIYVAFDSADAWAAPELFQFDEENNPIRVAGCPPDAFAKTDSFGEIHYITGSIIKRPGTHGGFRESGTVFSAMML